MRKRLTAIGGSLGFIIDKPIAELYRIDRDTEIEVTPREDGLDIRFVPKTAYASDESVEKAAEVMDKRYQRMMQNLAK